MLLWLWLWLRLAATVPIGPLAWEPPICRRSGPRKGKKKKKKFNVFTQLLDPNIKEERMACVGPCPVLERLGEAEFL